MKFFLWSRRAIYLLPFIVFIFLFTHYFVFSGKLEFVYDFKHTSPYVNVVPKHRLSVLHSDETGMLYQQVLSEPVYFDVRLPQPFVKGRITLAYENGGQDIIEIAGLVDGRDGSADVFGFHHAVLENLRWKHVREGDVVLWQRNEVYENVSQFLANLPPHEEIVVYRYSLGDGFDFLSSYVDLEQSEKNFVIAQYPETRLNTNGTQEKSVSFEMKRLQYGFHKYRFILSAPGVSVEDRFNLYELRFSFEREPITTDNFIEKSKRYLKRYF